MTKLNKIAKLNKAREVKNDEFYTRYEDVVKLFAVYDEDVRGKTLYLPFDDYEHSNFFKYYHENFTRLGLKRLIATSYKAGEVSKRVDIVDGVMTVRDLAGDGDFFSDECQAILKSEADIVISNPPFSCIREDELYTINKLDVLDHVPAHITNLAVPITILGTVFEDTWQLVANSNKVKVGGVQKFQRIIIKRKPLPKPEDL